MLLSTCALAGSFVDPAFDVDSGERSKRLADALLEFSKHHAVGLTEKRMSEVMLVFAAAGFIGPPCMEIYKRPKRPGPTRVVDIRSTAVEQPAAAQPPVNGKPAEVPSQVWIEPDTED